MRKAFSLIELAVVITIIGLLTAAVQAGIGVVKSAQTRALVAQLKEYKSSYYGFFSAYSGFPGDLSKASYFWSSAVNGDGDDFVEYGTGDSTAEFANAWNHMSLGDFISSDYSALTYPEAKDDLIKFIIIYYSDMHSQSGNSITVQADDFSGVMTPLEAYQLDCKLDDCSPTIGTTLIDNGASVKASDATCLNALDELNSKDVHTDACRVIMWLD